MKKITLTCPFTGLPFDALKSADGSLIVQNPITGENMRIGYNMPSKRYLIDERLFSKVDIINSVEAAEILGVTRARISKIVKDEVIPHFNIGDKYMFLRDDVLMYAESRSVGRPKEG